MIKGCGPVLTLSMTTGWLVRTSSYSVDIQRARPGLVCARDMSELRSIARCDGRERELRRVGAAGAKPRFLANDIDHDRIPSPDDLQLFPLVGLDMSRAGQILHCRSHPIMMLTQGWL
jgi:hypothetical protein